MIEKFINALLSTGFVKENTVTKPKVSVIDYTNYRNEDDIIFNVKTYNNHFKFFIAFEYRIVYPQGMIYNNTTATTEWTPIYNGETDDFDELIEIINTEYLPKHRDKKLNNLLNGTTNT